MTTKTTFLRPLADYVVVRPLEAEEKTLGGIILPDVAKKKPERGEVLEVGPGRRLEDGKRYEPDVQAGDVVLYTRYAGSEVEIDGEELKVLREAEILAVISDGE